MASPKNLRTSSAAAAALAVLTLQLSSCATSGRPINVEAVERMQPGLTTRQDAEALLGPPTTRVIRGDGAHTYSWSYAKVNGVTGRTESAAVILSFDRDGKLTTRTISDHPTTQRKKPPPKQQRLP